MIGYHRHGWIILGGAAIVATGLVALVIGAALVLFVGVALATFALALAIHRWWPWREVKTGPVTTLELVVIVVGFLAYVRITDELPWWANGIVGAVLAAFGMAYYLRHGVEHSDERERPRGGVYDYSGLPKQ